jgi:putative transposase
LAELGIAINQAPVRIWRSRVGRMMATQLRKRSVAHMPGYRVWVGAFVKINGQLLYLLRAVNHEREVLESVVAAKVARHVLVLKVLKRTMKTYG